MTNALQWEKAFETIEGLAKYLDQCFVLDCNRDSDEDRFYAGVAASRSQSVEEYLSFLSESFHLFVDRISDIKEQISSTKNVTLKVQKAYELREVFSDFQKEHQDLVYPKAWAENCRCFQNAQNNLDEYLSTCESLRQIDEENGIEFSLGQDVSSRMTEAKSIVASAREEILEESNKSVEELRTEFGILWSEISGVPVEDR